MEICALLTHARVCQPWVKISGVRAPELAAHFPAGPFDPAGCVKRAAYPAASWAKCGAPRQSLYSPSARRPMWAWPLQTRYAARLGDLLDLLGCVLFLSISCEEPGETSAAGSSKVSLMNA